MKKKKTAFGTFTLGSYPVFPNGEYPLHVIQYLSTFVYDQFLFAQRNGRNEFYMAKRNGALLLVLLLLRTTATTTFVIRSFQMNIYTFFRHVICIYIIYHFFLLLQHSSHKYRNIHTVLVFVLNMIFASTLFHCAFPFPSQFYNRICEMITFLPGLYLLFIAKSFSYKDNQQLNYVFIMIVCYCCRSCTQFICC